MFKMIIDTINQSYRCIFPYDYIIHAPNIDIHSLKYHSKLDHSIRNHSTVITRAPPCGCRPLIYFLFKGEGTLIFNHKGGRSGVKRGV